MFKKVTVCVVFLSLAACGSDAADSTHTLHQIFEEEWEFRLQENPLFATSVGVHDFNDRLPQVNEQAERLRARFREQLLARIGRIDRDRLSREDQINLDIFRIQLADRIAGFRYRSHLVPILADSGFHSSFARLPENVPLATVQDYENYILRMRAFHHYTREHIELMREGFEVGLHPAEGHPGRIRRVDSGTCRGAPCGKCLLRTFSEFSHCCAGGSTGAAPGSGEAGHP